MGDRPPDHPRSRQRCCLDARWAFVSSQIGVNPPDQQTSEMAASICIRSPDSERSLALALDMGLDARRAFVSSQGQRANGAAGGVDGNPIVIQRCVENQGLADEGVSTQLHSLLQ
jgi:hypothetical protein